MPSNVAQRLVRQSAYSSARALPIGVGRHDQLNACLLALGHMVRRFLSAAGLGPDTAVMQKLDLGIDHLLFVLGVLHRLTLEI
jgi:hypothetical protein